MEDDTLILTHVSDIDGSFKLNYKEPGTNFTLSLGGVAGSTNNDDSTVYLEYGDKIIATSVGFMQSDSLRLGSGTYGDGFTPAEPRAFHWDFVLGALQNYQDIANETYAPKAFFDRIVSCQVELVPISGTMPTVTDPIKLSYSALEDAELYSFQMDSEVNTPFELTMVVTFEYQADDYEQTQELKVYTVRANVFFKGSTDVSVNADDLLTTAELNNVLSGRNALKQYLEQKGVSYTWEGTLVINLPNVEYDGVVECGIMGTQGFYGVMLKGAEDDNHDPLTVMHALHVTGGLNFLQSVNFVADASVTQTYTYYDSATQTNVTEEPFTCGVLVDCNGLAGESSIYGIDGCTFSGYRYAVRSTAKGYHGSFSGNTVTNCEYGVYLDSPGLNAAGNSELSWNTFINCQDAILIAHLPATITAYMYRIHDNTFLNCGRHDINITDAGTFFCYGNYFGEGDLGGDVRRTARLSAGENTHIIANPCRATRDFNGPYWIDPDLPTEILNSEANGLRIDAAVFDGTQISIDVVDSSLDILGTWKFGGEGA